MKRFFALVLIGLLAVGAFAGCKKAETTKETTKEATTETATEKAAEETAKESEASAEIETEAAQETEAADVFQIEIKIKDYGTIKAELYPDVAPITVENFVKLAEEHFYDGLTFHRIIAGFMIQGGDPLGNGMGGSDQTIKGEFSANGIENSLAHVRGVLSMARAQDPNSASSQFFIMHADAPSLDGQYAAFGMVTEGIEIVDQICKDTPVTDRNGSVNKEDQPIIESITVVK